MRLVLEKKKVKMSKIVVLIYKEHATNLQMYLEYILRIMQLVYFAREK